MSVVLYADTNELARHAAETWPGDVRLVGRKREFGAAGGDGEEIER